MRSRVLTHISLPHTRWRAQGQYVACSIACNWYCLSACARAASRTSALLQLPPPARCAPNLVAAAREQNSRTIEAAANREDAAGSGSTGDPDEI